MPVPHLRIPSSVAAINPDTEQVLQAFSSLETEFGIPASYPAPAEQEASEYRLSIDELNADVSKLLVTDSLPNELEFRGRRYLTRWLSDDFVTIDPATSKDLDQAVFVQKISDGYQVKYAIADVAAFVDPLGAVAEESWKRGVTTYGPLASTGLHPADLAEYAGSLLPGVFRPAVVWEIELDSAGKVLASAVTRGLIKSIAKLSYQQVQDAIDSPESNPNLLPFSSIFETIKTVGLLREQREAKRGGASLNVPEQNIEVTDSEHFKLSFRQVLPIESWNSQFSLLAGFAAARMMVAAQVGMLRTLPPADERDIEKLRRTAFALGIEWRSEVSYPELLASLDPSNSKHVSFQNQATSLFRGAGYQLLHLTEEPAQKHSALANYYAHVTAPLRRLADRYVTEVCLVISQLEREDAEVSQKRVLEMLPEWVISGLAELPQVMMASTRAANSYTKAAVELVEAALVRQFLGKLVSATIIEVNEKKPYRGELILSELAVRARVKESSNQALPLATEILAVATEADLATRKVQFETEIASNG